MINKLDDCLKLSKQAEVLARLGDWGEAARQINSSIVKLEPKNIDAHNRLARCHILFGDKEAAEQVYQQVLLLSPDNLVAKNNLFRIRKNLPIFKDDKLFV